MCCSKALLAGHGGLQPEQMTLRHNSCEGHPSMLCVMSRVAAGSQGATVACSQSVRQTTLHDPSNTCSCTVACQQAHMTLSVHNRSAHFDGSIVHVCLFKDRPQLPLNVATCHSHHLQGKGSQSAGVCVYDGPQLPPHELMHERATQMERQNRLGNGFGAKVFS